MIVKEEERGRGSGLYIRTHKGIGHPTKVASEFKSNSRAARPGTIQTPFDIIQPPSPYVCKDEIFQCEYSDHTHDFVCMYYGTASWRIIRRRLSWITLQSAMNEFGHIDAVFHGAHQKDTIPELQFPPSFPFLSSQFQRLPPELHARASHSAPWLPSSGRLKG